MEPYQSNSINFFVKLICKETQRQGEQFLPLSREDFMEFLPQNGNWSDSKGNWFEYRTELTEKYFWLYALKGSSKPRNPSLIDTQNRSNVENTRPPHLVEPTDPFFALIIFNDDCTAENFYIYPDKNQIIIEILNDKVPSLKGVLHIKRCFLPKEELIKKIKEVNEFHFAENKKSRQLFKVSHQIPDIRKHLVDFFGFNLPTDFKISIKTNLPLNEKVRLSILKLIEGREMRVFSSLKIKARDEDNNETVLDNSYISKKLSIEAKINENGIYSENEVEKIKLKLLETINEK